MARDNSVGAVLPRENHHGHSPTWISTTAGEVEVLIFRRSLGSLESMVPLPVGDNTVNRAAVGTLHPFDIHWSKKIFDDDAFPQSLDTTALHFIEAAFF